MSRVTIQGMRLPSLDGWRAVAISVVLLDHVNYTRGAVVPAWWKQAFQGNLGVRVFFVISGLLITYLLLTEADRRGHASLGAFYVRRALRIFPVYFLYVAALAAPGLYSDATSSWIGTLTFRRDLIGRGNSVTVHYWSLAVEEQFYMVWPALLVGLSLWKRPRLAAALLLVPILVCPILRSGAIQARWPNPFVLRALGSFSIALYADSLAIGCLGAFLYRAYGGTGRRFASAGALVFALAVFVAAMAVDDGRFGAMGAALLPPVEAAAMMGAIWVTIERRSGVVYKFLNAGP